MIRGLRRKFILINMGLVTLVLLIVFGALVVSSCQQQARMSGDALHRVLAHGGPGPAKPTIGAPPRSIPAPLAGAAVFSATQGADGALLSVWDEEVTISDGTVRRAVAEAAADGKREGVLRALSLRYLAEPLPNGTVQYAFLDLSAERESLRVLLTGCLLVGAGGLLAFFAVSVFLANWALRPVARAWERQRQFVADASHELKTPLTVILANTDILLAHPEDTVRQQSKWITHTREEARRMKAMTEELLFLARFDAAPQARADGDVDLSDAAWSCLLPFEPVAFERGISLESEIMPGVSVRGDSGQLRQLMVILLDNAVKYAEEGGRVRFTLAETPGGARLTVHNTGQPIPPEHLPHIFERFYRADASRGRGTGGAGLGLSIAARIVEGHGGKITAESKEGTSLVVSFCRRGQHPAKKEDAAHPAPRP